MEMTRTHTFDAPIDEVWTMFRDREAHVAKFEAMGHREIEVLAYDGDDDHVRLEVRRVVDIEVPGFAKKVIRPSNTVTSIDDWTRHDDGTCTGTQVIHTPNPVDITSTTALRPADDGRTTYEITVAIKVNVPLIGGKVANFAKGDVEKQLRDEFACGDAWLTEHAG